MNQIDTPDAISDAEIAAFPRYIAWVNTRQFYLCSKLADALEWRGTAGALVYEPLAYSTAELLYVRDQLAAANERIAELLVGAEASGKLIDQGVVRIGELEKQLAEREAEIQRLSAILDSYTE